MDDAEQPWRAARGAVQFPPGTPPSEELIRRARGDTPDNINSKDDHARTQEAPPVLVKPNGVQNGEEG